MRRFQHTSMFEKRGFTKPTNVSLYQKVLVDALNLTMRLLGT